MLSVPQRDPVLQWKRFSKLVPETRLQLSCFCFCTKLFPCPVSIRFGLSALPPPMGGLPPVALPLATALNLSVHFQGPASPAPYYFRLSMVKPCQALSRLASRMPPARLLTLGPPASSTETNDLGLP